MKIKISGKSTIFGILAYEWISSVLFRDSNYSKFGFDLLLIILMYFIVAKKKSGVIKNRLRGTGKLPIVFGTSYIVVCLISSIINETPIIQTLWNARTSFAMIIFWVGCVFFIDENDIMHFNGFLLKFNHINFIACILQFLLLNIQQDLMGGIFGSYVGVNSILNVFLIITTTLAFNCFLNRCMSFCEILLVASENLIIASLSELKIYYVEIALIFGVILILNKPSFKTILIVVIAAIGMPTIINLFYKFNPYYIGFFSLDKIFESFDMAYASNGGLSRGRAWSYIQNNFLKNKIDLLFGIGFGNATYSSMSFLSSDFYKKYSYLKYNYFSHSYKLLESGYLGAITFIAFFVSPAMNFNNDSNQECKVLARTISIVCILLFVYNTCLMNYNTMFMITFVICEICIESKKVK